MAKDTLQQHSGADVLQAVDLVLDRCAISQALMPDAVVALEAQALRTVRTLVQAQWPLSGGVKARINIGAVAAKNLADWNEDLVASLMLLQHVLTHDGESLDKLLGPISA